VNVIRPANQHSRTGSQGTNHGGSLAGRRRGGRDGMGCNANQRFSVFDQSEGRTLRRTPAPLGSWATSVRFCSPLSPGAPKSLTLRAFFILQNNECHNCVQLANKLVDRLDICVKNNKTKNTRGPLSPPLQNVQHGLVHPLHVRLSERARGARHPVAEPVEEACSRQNKWSQATRKNGKEKERRQNDGKQLLTKFFQKNGEHTQAQRTV